MTNNKIRKLLAIVACVLALVLFAVGLINLPKRGSESGLKVLENYRIQQRYVQLAKRVALPAGHGATMEFRKWNTFARAGKLQEGVTCGGCRGGNAGGLCRKGTACAQDRDSLLYGCPQRIRTAGQ